MNKITVTKWNEVYKSSEKETVVDWNGSELHIKKNISYAETVQFVNEAANVCFGDSGEYHPENLNFAFRAGAVMHYTNATVPTDGEKAYALLYGTDIYDILCGKVNQAQLDMIREAIECRIGYLIDMRTHEIASAIADLRDLMQGITEKVRDVTAGVGDLDGEQVKKFIETVSELGKIDEGKLVDALSEKGIIGRE